MIRFGWNLAYFSPWMNTWGIFYFSKILIFGAWGRVFCENEARTLGQHVGPQKIVPFGWNLGHFFSYKDFSFFEKCKIWGLGQVFSKLIWKVEKILWSWAKCIVNVRSLLSFLQCFFTSEQNGTVMCETRFWNFVNYYIIFFCYPLLAYCSFYFLRPSFFSTDIKQKETC